MGEQPCKTRHNPKGNELLQPAVKCRGKEYLRIIYGPEYTLRNNLLRLKKRSLSKKRSLASREFALGMESLERYPIQVAGASIHKELWIPAEELEEFNKHIIGNIDII